MKKLFALSLLIIFAAFSANAYAATKARTASQGVGIEMVNGIGDLSGGNTVEVNDEGGLATAKRSRAVTAQLGDGQLYTGACYIQTITISGVSAGDSAAIYDNTSATGTAKFDPKIDTANGSYTINANGAPFATGIYVDATDTEVHTSVVYDY